MKSGESHYIFLNTGDFTRDGFIRLVEECLSRKNVRLVRSRNVVERIYEIESGGAIVAEYSGGKPNINGESEHPHCPSYPSGPYLFLVGAKRWSEEKIRKELELEGLVTNLFENNGVAERI